MNFDHVSSSQHNVSSSVHNVYSPWRVAVNPLKPQEFDLLHTGQWDELVDFSFDAMRSLASLTASHVALKHDLHSLRNYLRCRLMRAIMQQRAVCCLSENDAVLMFNTDLRTDSGEDLYAICTSRFSSDAPPYAADQFCSFQQACTIMATYLCDPVYEVLGFFDPVTFPVAPFRRDFKIVCTPQNMKHLIEHVDRVFMIAKVVPGFASWQAKKQIAYLLDAVQHTATRARSNDKDDIMTQFFFKSVYDHQLQCMRMRGQVQILLPLHTADGKALPVAACLHLWNDAYYVRTVLPLSSAWTNAQLFAINKV